MAGFPGNNTWFFDAAAVLKAVDAAERRVLSRMGAFVRTRARSSIRTRKASSRPGEPPTNRTGLLKKFLFFGYDPGTRSVVVGPAAFKSRPTTPHLLEFGGTAGRREVRLGGRWVTARRQGGPPRGRLAGVATRVVGTPFAARPFMRPAEAAERPKFAGLFKGSVNKG